MVAATPPNPQPDTARATQEDDSFDVEPDDHWKAGVKKKLDAVFGPMLKDAKETLEKQLEEPGISYAERECYNAEYAEAVQTIYGLMAEAYDAELDRERTQRCIAVQEVKSVLLLQELLEREPDGAFLPEQFVPTSPVDPQPAWVPSIDCDSQTSPLIPPVLDEENSSSSLTCLSSPPLDWDPLIYYASPMPPHEDIFIPPVLNDESSSTSSASLPVPQQARCINPASRCRTTTSGYVSQATDASSTNPRSFSTGLGPKSVSPVSGAHVPSVVPANAPESNNKVFVGNLPTYLKEEQVMELFGSFGELKAFNLVRDNGNGASKGFAFFEYTDPGVTDAAIQSLDGMELGDRYLIVRRASDGTEPGTWSSMLPNQPCTQVPETAHPVMPTGPNDASETDEASFKNEQKQLEDMLSKTNQLTLSLAEQRNRIWSEMLNLSQLHWSDFPWPMFKSPSSLEEITFGHISAYIHSEYHLYKNKLLGDLINVHMRRWNPVRFTTELFPKVVKWDKERVKAGSELVLRYLHELLNRTTFPNPLGTSDHARSLSFRYRLVAPTTAPECLHANSSTLTSGALGTSAADALHGSSDLVPEAEQRRRLEDLGQMLQERLRRERDAFEVAMLSKTEPLSAEKVAQLILHHYQAWERLPNLDELRWFDFPWPMFKTPTSPKDITLSNVSAYVKSMYHPDKDRAMKERVKDLIRRWHPDRFEAKLLPKVAESEKDKVAEGAETVVRFLNELYHRTNPTSPSTRPYATTGNSQATTVTSKFPQFPGEKNQKQLLALGKEFDGFEQQASNLPPGPAGEEEPKIPESHVDADEQNDLNNHESSNCNFEQGYEDASYSSKEDEPEDVKSEGGEELNAIGANQKPDMFSDVCTVLKVVFLNKDKYQKFLNLDQSTAQMVLDIIQNTLDYAVTNSVDSEFENMLLKAMLRLAKRSTLYPRSYVLSDIERDEYPVASGHFGEIFQGRCNGRKVSLKVFKLYSNQMSDVSSLLKAFYREAILWRHLTHPNLLPFYGIYQLGDSGGRICLVSPWMNNGNVTQYLQRYPNANRQYLVMDIAQGISYLHGRSIIHGDLKGVNVLISDDGVACLADFGLSSVMNSHSLAWTSIETTISNAGTVRWQAPELIDSEDNPSEGVTKESDIYAFACVCYEILTGKIPFYHFTIDATVIFKVMKGQRPLRLPLELNQKQGVTDWMWFLIEECWNQEPTNRPTASEVVARLCSRAGFSRGVSSDQGGNGWGDLRPEVFRSLVNQRSSVSEEDIQNSMYLLRNI